MGPHLSICIPTYNGAAYLADCLDSVLGQTFADFELLVVDDCSSDDTLRIANDYARRDPRIRIVLNAENLGLVGNWNRCVQLSRGEWIKFVFQDDLILPDCVARMHAVARDTEAPIVSCARDFIFEEGTSEELREEYLKCRARTQEVFQGATHWSAQDFCHTALQSPTVWNILGEPTAVLLHRNVFERFGWFNPSLRMFCDFEFWVRVASNTGTVHLAENLATFRVHRGSTSGHFRETTAGRYRFDMIDPLLVIHEYAFHPLFARLRAVGAERRPRRDLEDEFWRRALMVQWFARRAVRDPAHPDPSLLDEWHVAARDCPRLTTIPFKARMLSKWRTLKRALTSPVRRRRTTNVSADARAQH